MTRYSVLLFVVFAFAKANYSTAQSKPVKLEREERLEASEFPTQALIYLEGFANGSRVKYYREYDDDRTSYEGKFKKDGKRYSIEFSKDGSLEDVEIEVKSRELEEALWERISRTLDSISERWRVEKIQQQYLPQSMSIESLEPLIATGQFQNLELVVAFKEKRKIYRRELLFNNKGELVTVREVKRIAYDFLLF